uniref:CNNM transmembrane domain-containing protein n=1 Tax=Hanusia phi TaxID=3032 RepID=A0A7S0E099_9CRYP|mmetsp:Transcript_13086/g.30097  ORF Transcript_13086/g.30097 Transcript_13086/m.30097 type:complete len:488 (+) Transcript_13086:60-1523(+)
MKHKIFEFIHQVQVAINQNSFLYYFDPDPVDPSVPGGEPEHVECCSPAFWMYIMLCVFLVLFAAIMAGLTMALMSLDAMNIAIIEASGTDNERKYASAIKPLIQNRHLLLVTLLIGNATAMEALPIFLDRLVPNYMAIILSVTFVLAFGEILPQAVFTKFRLPIGAYFSYFVLTLELILFPIAWPISKMLDYFLGKDHPTIYRRAELKELTRQHLINCDGHGTLTQDEVKVMSGVLDMANKQAKDAMHSIDGVFMLDAEAVLDMSCMREIMSSGHSRIPIFVGSKDNVVGLLIVKNIILVDPENNTKVKDVSRFAIRKIPKVSDKLPLFELLHFFGQGRAHLALVCQEDPTGLTPIESCPVIGIITMEDVIEELIQEEILDETDVGPDAAATLADKFIKKQRRAAVLASAQQQAAVSAPRDSHSVDISPDRAWRTAALAALMKRGRSAESQTERNNGTRGRGSLPNTLEDVEPEGLEARLLPRKTPL